MLHKCSWDNDPQNLILPTIPSLLRVSSYLVWSVISYIWRIRQGIRYQIFIFLIIGSKMGILINNMKVIHTSTFTIIHTNFNPYLEKTQTKQREIIIRRKESVNHKEDTIYEYIYYIKKSLKIIIVFLTLNNLLFFSW